MSAAVDRTQARAAYEATATDRASVDLSTAKAYALDATYAAIVAAGILRRLAPHREAIEALPHVDQVKIGRFDLYADALFYAQTAIVIHDERKKKMPALAAEGWKVRRILLQYAELLVTLGRFPAEVLERFRGGAGYVDLVEDLGGLAECFRDAPELVGPGATLPGDVVQRADALAEAMMDQWGVDHDADAELAQLVAERHKLGVLLLEAHREIRRAVAFLRFHEGDAAVLVPPLFAPRKGRRRARGDAED